MCRVLTPSIVKLYKADKARECESLMTLHTDRCYKLVSVNDDTDTDMLVEDHVDTTGMCYKLVSVMDNTDTYMLVNDHAETTDLSGLTHVRYDMINAFRLAHKEVKANTEQRKVANQVGIPRTGINDNKGKPSRVSSMT